MSEAEIAGAIRAFYLEVYPHGDRTLDDDTDLLGEWFVDSLGVVQTVQFLEDTFGVAIGRADINADNFHSVRTMAAFVRRKLG
ncbi:MAG: acyl carrier protein [Nannocystaceae bacterium]